MFDELDYYLSQHTSEYRKQNLLAGITMAFEVLGTPILDRVNDLIFSSNDLASDVGTQLIADFIRESLVQAISEFGVVLNPEFILDENLPIYCDIVSTLLIVDQYEDPHRILALLEDADDTEQALAALVQEVTGQAEDNVMDVLLTVDRDLTAKIMEENAAHVVGMEARSLTTAVESPSRACIERLKYSEHYSREGFVESNLVTSRLFGYEPFVILESMAPAIYDLEVEQIPTVCYQIACASNVATNAVVGTAKNLVERILTEDQSQERQKVAFLLNRYPVPSVEL